jgi:hypothetical protein
MLGTGHHRVIITRAIFAAGSARARSLREKGDGTRFPGTDQQAGRREHGYRTGRHALLKLQTCQTPFA